MTAIFKKKNFNGIAVNHSYKVVHDIEFQTYSVPSPLCLPVSTSRHQCLQFSSCPTKYLLLVTVKVDDINGRLTHLNQNTSEVIVYCHREDLFALFSFLMLNFEAAKCVLSLQRTLDKNQSN